jgi:hypothetical protein
MANRDSPPHSTASDVKEEGGEKQESGESARGADAEPEPLVMGKPDRVVAGSPGVAFLFTASTISSPTPALRPVATEVRKDPYFPLCPAIESRAGPP